MVLLSSTESDVNGMPIYYIICLLIWNCMIIYYEDLDSITRFY